jgi:hypothetical protein
MMPPGEIPQIALKTMTTVIETSNGWAGVRERERHMLADGSAPNSAAWRWIDCQNGEPISRAASSTGVVPGFTAGRRGA